MFTRLKKRDCSFIAGVDLWLPYLIQARKAHQYAALIQADSRYLPFRDHVFDATLCLETIEHLPKIDGPQLLSELSRVAQLNVVSSPLGHTPQDSYDRNPHQEHMSAWWPEDFQSRGFKLVKSTGVRIRWLSDNTKFVLRLLPAMFGTMLFFIPFVFKTAGADGLYLRVNTISQAVTQ